MRWAESFSFGGSTPQWMVTLGDVRRAGWVEQTGVSALLAPSKVRSHRPTPDPTDQLAPQGEWTVFVSPTRANEK